jgi:hypothetical protein
MIDTNISPVFDQLHSAQQEINNLRLLNVCLQSTLLRVQTQLIEYLPVNIPDEIKRNETKEKLALLRSIDDQTRRIVHHQQSSFFDHLKTLFENKQEQQIKPISLSKNEKQIEILFEMFHELNTIIHTEHNDRISQLYITLAQTSHSVIKAREGKSIFSFQIIKYLRLVLDHTIHAHKIIEKRQFQRQIIYILIAFIFISILIFLILIH